MRVALIADIQGNALALETVLSDMQRYQPDQIVCLGDVATGPNPTDVLQLLRERNCAVVMGNMDAAILDLQPYTGQDADEHKYAEIDSWCAAQLRADDRDYIRSFQSTIIISFGGQCNMLCCHGSPHSFDDVIDSTTSRHDLNVLLSDCDAAIVAVGHMHNPMLRRHRRQWIVNPGSVGLPGGGKNPPIPLIAEYAVVEVVDKVVCFHFERVGYDRAQFRSRVLSSGMLHAEWYLSQWKVNDK